MEWIDALIDAFDDLLTGNDEARRRRRDQRRARRPEHVRDLTWWQRIKRKLG